MSVHTHRALHGQRGMVLITSLLLLLILTMLAVSMFRSYGVQERIAGNTRDKQRARSAAISAQQYAETWLSTTTDSLAHTQFTSNSINGVSNVVRSSNATGDTATQAASYYAAPMFYIAYLGAANGIPGGVVYQIDAVGYGGTINTVAVVESTYVIAPTTSKPADK